jgi:enhancing lycopene biosynthesis protein 2
MPAPYSTILLDTVAWDLVLDSHNNIAVAAPPYALAQDAASAIRTFLGEVYYDTTVGVPYWTKILGQLPPMSLLKAKLIAAAMTVPGVVGSQCFITSFNNRVIGGQVQVTDVNGLIQAATF